jgi:hypothetical protein
LAPCSTVLANAASSVLGQEFRDEEQYFRRALLDRVLIGLGQPRPPILKHLFGDSLIGACAPATEKLSTRSISPATEKRTRLVTATRPFFKRLADFRYIIVYGSDRTRRSNSAQRTD